MIVLGVFVLFDDDDDDDDEAEFSSFSFVVVAGVEELEIASSFFFAETDRILSASRSRENKPKKGAFVMPYLLSQR